MKSSVPTAAVLQAGIWAVAAVLSPALSQVAMPAMSAQAPATTAVQSPTDAAPAFPAGAVVQSLPARPPEPSGVGFQDWLSGFRSRAQAAGIRPATLDRELAGLTFNYNTLDSTRDPRNGFYAEVKTDFAGLGGDSRYFRATGDARYYH
ncbi:MAG: BamA/TamA family outer membrane protein, partial [Thermaurantiacus sp.]